MRITNRSNCQTTSQIHIFINKAKADLYMDWLQTYQSTSQIVQIVAAKRKEKDTDMPP
jgi:hypothetical protein